MTHAEEFSPFEAALQRAAPALERSEIPFLLAGSLASWARGGPQSDHDLDLIVRPEDAERALECLAEAGMRTERPPMDWLYKAWDGDTLVDIIFRPAGLTVDDALFARSDRLTVAGRCVAVLPLEDLLVTKLMALSHTRIDYAPIVEIARAIREQVDWGSLQSRTARSPFARAFFHLLRELEIIDVAERDSDLAEVRVVAGSAVHAVPD